MRTCPADDLYFQQSPRVLLFDFKKGRRGPVSNWSGPVWVLSSVYLAEGLARYGFGAEARELAIRTARLLADDLARTGMLHECWNDAGEGLWPRRGTFVSWNVLGPWLLDRHALMPCRPQTCEGPGLLRRSARASREGAFVQRVEGVTADGRSAPAGPSDRG